MQIGGKNVENLLVGMMLKKCFKKENIDLKRHNSTPLYLGMHTSLPENALNRFQFGGV